MVLHAQAAAHHAPWPHTRPAPPRPAARRTRKDEHGWRRLLQALEQVDELGLLLDILHLLCVCVCARVCEGEGLGSAGSWAGHRCRRAGPSPPTPLGTPLTPRPPNTTPPAHPTPPHLDDVQVGCTRAPHIHRHRVLQRRLGKRLDFGGHGGAAGGARAGRGGEQDEAAAGGRLNLAHTAAARCRPPARPPART